VTPHRFLSTVVKNLKIYLLPAHWTYPFDTDRLGFGEGYFARYVVAYDRLLATKYPRPSIVMKIILLTTLLASCVFVVSGWRAKTIEFKIVLFSGFSVVSLLLPLVILSFAEYPRFRFRLDAFICLSGFIVFRYFYAKLIIVIKPVLTSASRYFLFASRAK